MKLRLAGVLVTLFGFVASAGIASADLGKPPVNLDGSGHTHHVTLGTGGCLDIDAVSWDGGTENGLHQGASASTIDRGPWHLACP